MKLTPEPPVTTRQVRRAALRDHHYIMASVAPDSHSPHPPRAERRKVCRALAARDFKAGLSATAWGIL